MDSLLLRAPINTKNYIPAVLSQTTWFRRIVTSGGCTHISKVIEIPVYSVFSPGSIQTTGETVCGNDDPSLIGNSVAASGGDGVIDYQWESSTDPSFSTVTDIPGATEGSFDPPSGVTSTTYYRRLAKDGSCHYNWEASAGTWQLTATPIISNNTVDFTHGAHGVICATAPESTNAILNAPEGTVFCMVNFASFGNPTGTCPNFTVGSCHASISQSVAEGCLLGNNYTLIMALPGLFGDPCIGVAKNFCVAATYTEPICKGTLPGTITGSTPTGGSGSFTYYWESSITGYSGSFSAASGTNYAKDYTPGALSQTTWFRRTVTSGLCSIVSRVIQVTVVPESFIGGEPTATPPILCPGDTSALNAISAGNAINWYTQSSGGILLGSSASGENFKVSPATTTTYYAAPVTLTPYTVHQTFNFTGTSQLFTVPTGVTRVSIDAFGAGGIDAGGPPGKGGRARGVLAVTPGQELYIYVGGQGATPFNGGGLGVSGANGGDASDVRVGGTTLANRIIVAGGGGGAGSGVFNYWYFCTNQNGNGGGGTPVDSNFVGGAGGAAGYSNGCGFDGGITGGIGGLNTSWDCGGGGGGGIISGGNGGNGNNWDDNSPISGGNGTLGQGGNAIGIHSNAGGGGGGYFGGGGAAACSQTGQGGGGSSWTGTLTSPLLQGGVKSGNGQVIISWNQFIANCPSATRSPVTVTVRPVFTAGSVATTGESIDPGGDPGIIGSITDASGGGGAISYQWQSSIDSTFTTPAIIISNTASYDPPSGLTVTTWYRRQAMEAICNTSWISSAGVWKVAVFQHHQISGWMKYNNDQKPNISGVTLSLKDSQGNAVGTPSTTDANGSFHFTGLSNGIYTIAVTNNTHSPGSINSTDALLVNNWVTTASWIQHVQFLAGDVYDNGIPDNLNYFITSNDALHIQQYLVNGGTQSSNYTYFDRGPWCYYKADSLIVGGNMDPHASIPDITLLLTGSDLILNLYAQVTGDFDGSYVPDGSKSGNNNLNLVYESKRESGPEKEFDLPVHIVNPSKVDGISMILNFPDDLVEVKDVTIKDNQGQLDWKVSGNELRIGWNSLIPLYLAASSDLVILRLKTTAAFIKDASIRLSLVPNPLNELADDQSNPIVNAVLKVDVIAASPIGIDEQTAENELTMECHPNPFSNYTMINYTLPFDGNVTLEIRNLLGLTLQTLVNEMQTKGAHSLKFDAASLVPGIFTATITLENSNEKVFRTVKIVRKR